VFVRIIKLFSKPYIKSEVQLKQFILEKEIDIDEMYKLAVSMIHTIGFIPVSGLKK